MHACCMGLRTVSLEGQFIPPAQYAKGSAILIEDVSVERYRKPTGPNGRMYESITSHLVRTWRQPR